MGPEYSSWKRRCLWLCAVSLFIVLFAAGTGLAYYTFRRFVPLHDVRASGAYGEVTIEPYGSFIPGQRVIGIDAFHLKPRSVYTVWLSDGGPRYGKYGKPGIYSIGEAANYFRTNADGVGRYVITASEYDLEGWRFIEVDYHPDGDPKNTKDMVTVLKGDMVYGYHS